MKKSKKTVENRDCLILFGAFILFAVGGTMIQASYRPPSIETEMLRVYCLAVSSGLMDTERAGDLLIQMRRDALEVPDVLITERKGVEKAIQELNRVPAPYECGWDFVYYYGLFGFGWLFVFLGFLGPLDYFRTSKKWGGTVLSDDPPSTKKRRQLKGNTRLKSP
ncbi:MAG: hypothetical protein AB7P49_11460 [Bdellovibrionales bacterium]